MKFRIWDKSVNLYHYCDGLEFLKLSIQRAELIFHRTGNEWSGGNHFPDIKDNFIFEQCSPLLDVNSKPIYEGDIIIQPASQPKDRLFLVCSPGLYWGLTVINNGGKRWKLEEALGSCSRLTRWDGHPGELERYEVIGNRHENSELIIR